LSNNAKKPKQTKGIFKILDIERNHIQNYKSDESQRRMFERFIFGDNNKYKNNQKVI